MVSFLDVLRFIFLGGGQASKWENSGSLPTYDLEVGGDHLCLWASHFVHVSRLTLLGDGWVLMLETISVL